MKVLVVVHGPLIEPGWLGDALEEMVADFRVVDPSLNDPLPVGDWDKVVVMGGHMGAYDVAQHPWLTVEKDYIRTRLAAATPVLGVCLGSQLIADIIGGRAYPSPTTEVGFIEIQRTPAGETDTALAAIAGPVVSWHHDTFDLPSEAELLAFTDGYPHAFRYRSALGVQFHPEVTPEMWDSWTTTYGTGDLTEAGLDPQEFADRLAGDSARLRSQAVDFFRSWLQE